MFKHLFIAVILAMLPLTQGCKSNEAPKSKLTFILKLEQGITRNLVDSIQVILDYTGQSPFTAAPAKKVIFGGKEFYIERKDSDNDGQVEVLISSIANPFTGADTIQLNITSSTVSDLPIRVLASVTSGSESIAKGEASLDEANIPIAFNTQYAPVARATLNCLDGQDCFGTNHPPVIGAINDLTVFEREQVRLTVGAAHDWLPLIVVIGIDDPATMKRKQGPANMFRVEGIFANAGRVVWGHRNLSYDYSLVFSHPSRSRSLAAGPFNNRQYGSAFKSGKHLFLFDDYDGSDMVTPGTFDVVDVSAPFSPQQVKTLSSSSRSPAIGTCEASGKVFILFKDGLVGVYDKGTLDRLAELDSAVTPYDLATTPATARATLPLNGWMQAGAADGQILYVAGSSLQVISRPCNEVAQ